ncbi:M20 family metallopeptidase [Anaerovorax odorimutans]|uniref:M20 family metallopeptidase n=1 Tax=Anaerovorax odorimutans TaxID=109327 RepID=A0ABT1RM22_9FIRM|nr:M20 family metallopeptidase [Anaerovorax odorimutans]
MIIQNLNEYIQEAEQLAKEVFEEIHSWPELGNEEFKTVTLIGRKLKEMKLEISRPLATAVTADIKGKGNPQKCIALRADIDALPIAEEAMVSYRSRRAGLMHACGHDAHTAILVGLAQVLHRLKNVLPCDVRLIFQPDEEGKGGADRLIETGVLKGVDQIFSFHVKPDLMAGTIGVQYGTVHGESRMLEVRIKGTPAHGAKPDLGRDAVYGAAQFISLCQGIVSRDLDPVKAGLISFGRIRGGEAGNILAGQVELEGIIRGEDGEVCDRLCQRIRILARGLSQAMGLSIDVKFTQGYRALINDRRSAEQVKLAAGDKAVEINRKSMTVDDFSSYLQLVPGAYFFLGCGFADRENSGLHTSRFQINEKCLATGIETLAQICMKTQYR